MEEEERKEMSIREQIDWYLDRMDERLLRKVLLCVFRIFLGTM